MALTDAGYRELNYRAVHAAAVAILTNYEWTSRLAGDVN
ncbi:Uncharacterised protein [Yersinia mollaretii]|uniref:Uncharacterized protein n=2 Tax=Yersinia mollaretii TaxID=33060 RepID=A0AA36LSN9_YERMO|nr:hypothetical protein ymoll0001_40460 [Yersinia mollaretii ATCC 43969]CNF55699.1 Uncharacterised protein [Yersinia mollaretii]CNI75765.1 Uncharacterised protein [Yersinia mollaretii]CQJ34431.1 Uncharacterised protein [Yersinia mollaretii]